MNHHHANRAIALAVASLSLLSLCASRADPPTTARISEQTPLSPFGIGSCYVNNRSVNDDSRWIPKMEEIGLRFLRTPETSWRAVEPEEGKWTWENLDAQMTYLRDHHFRFGGLLYGGVPWDKTGRPFGLPVENLPAWSNYVSEMVKHVRGRIKYWEVWNEPPNGTRQDQTPADYARVVVGAYDAAKSQDPACLVGLAAKSVHVNYLEQVIKAGAKDHFDYIVLHPYEVLGTVADNAGTEALYLSIVPTVRKMLAAQNPAKANVPIIFTEIGSDAAKGEDHQANALVKAYTLGIAEGVACIEWFEGLDGDSGPMGLIGPNGKPRPSFVAMSQLIRCLGQHPVYLGWALLNEKDYGFAFQGADSTVLIGWARGSAEHKVDFGVPVRIITPSTGGITSASSCVLTSTPILVVGPPPGLVAQAKKNRARPIPWGGDYSSASSVSVTMGKTNVERGLHTLSGDSIAADVVAYGGAARAGSIPGGNVFVVDPGFLSYTPTPIDVTVVVRRNQANDNAGFKLNYESTNGFKNLGWYTVPDNKEWHSKTWHITDAEFVAMYGFNFSLDSDGNEYNKYYIQSVTVTKSK